MSVELMIETLFAYIVISMESLRTWAMVQRTYK